MVPESAVTRRSTTPHAVLARAAEALAKAVDAKADPWRVAELRLKYDAALESALADESVDAGRGLQLDTVARAAVPALPLAWLDESVPARARRGES